MTSVILTLVISLYFALDASSIWGAVRSLVPAAQVYRFDFVEKQLNRIIGGYIRGQLLMALIIGSTTGLGMFILGVRFPVVIGVAAFIFELVPMIGPVMTGLLALIIAAFQGFPLVLYVLIFYVALQLVESNVLGPRISGHAVGLHPVASMLALVTGGRSLWAVGRRPGGAHRRPGVCHRLRGGEAVAWRACRRPRRAFQAVAQGTLAACWRQYASDLVSQWCSGWHAAGPAKLRLVAIGRTGNWTGRVARLRQAEDHALFGVVTRSMRSYGSHACGIFAAAIAFFGVLSVFPLLLLLVTLFALVLNASDAASLVLNNLSVFFPGSADLLTNAVDAV
ncbi:MAG: AI-2E family transporter, partial [Chloroflexota bacterium]